MTRPRVAFVVQRYGLDICGGAETHCRWICERLRDEWDLEVFTSTALDHHGWKDHYPRGDQLLNQVRVHRFSSRDPRRLGVPQNLPGPYVPDLVAELERRRPDFDFFVFFTYLYYPTAHGLPRLAPRAVMVPTAHDEPNLANHDFYRDAFERAAFFVFNTPEERDVVRRHYAIETTPHVFAALGVDEPALVATAPGEPYLVYVGRIERAKGVATLLRYFLQFKRRHPGPLKLKLVGKVFPDIDEDEIREHPELELVGFVTDDERDRLIKGSVALCNPSLYESLSIVLLEAWNLGVPALCNGRCEVLDRQCRRAQAGIPYGGYFEFEAALLRLQEDPVLRALLGANGRTYVDRNYRWHRVLDGWRQVAAALMASAPPRAASAP